MIAVVVVYPFAVRCCSCSSTKACQDKALSTTTASSKFNNSRKQQQQQQQQQQPLMALNPSSKRKPAPSNHPHLSASHARKRAKTHDARTLAVQSSEAALSKTGELDVAAFVSAREFEIRALESGIQNSKSALTTRAFQKVPRNLRRRTASHNVKRVPSRLRARAKREVSSSYIFTIAFGIGRKSCAVLFVCD